MALPDLWIDNPEELRSKDLRQIIGIAGDGKLLDGSDASQEIRTFLRLVPWDMLARYSQECLTAGFDGSGFALQDVINETGRRLEFEVADGRYRGTRGEVGYDGLWRVSSLGSIVVEVKTTDTYRIDLDVIADYRTTLVEQGEVAEADSSILIVVGRADTGGLEAQIRGSPHAWDVRVISVDALVRLLRVKTELDEELPVETIYGILRPREYTRVDSIIDLVFATAEEAYQEREEAPRADSGATGPVPADFHEACVDRIRSRFDRPLVKRSKTKYMTSDGKLALTCSVSKEYGTSTRREYWFAFHTNQREYLKRAENAYVLFGCGTPDRTLLVPFNTWNALLDTLNITERVDRMYWHVKIVEEAGRYELLRKGAFDRVDLSEYLASS